MTEVDYTAPVAGVKRNSARALCVCKKCNKEFKPKKYNTITYCSRECAFADIKAWRVGIVAAVTKPGNHSLVYFNTCKQCNKQWTDRRRKSLCSSECSKLFNCQYSRDRSASKKIVSIKTCKCCSNRFTAEYGNKKSVFCSTLCLKSFYKRSYRAKRRAVERGLSADSVDPFRVFNRDGWKCQLCKVRTPKTKRGTYDDNAPELDHIIPVSKDGAHTYMNTQCLCRKCNQLKSNSIRGQMLMFG